MVAYVEGECLFIVHVSTSSTCSSHQLVIFHLIRRAFFGRFILRAFGIPTIARPSPGHGALAHWTPSGWVVCLGPPWGKGNTKEKYGRVNDTDFLEHTRARANNYSFKRVVRSRLIGDVIGGEGKCFGLSSARGELGFWNVFTLHVQRSLAEGQQHRQWQEEGR